MVHRVYPLPALVPLSLINPANPLRSLLRHEQKRCFFHAVLETDLQGNALQVSLQRQLLLLDVEIQPNNVLVGCAVVQRLNKGDRVLLEPANGEFKWVLSSNEQPQHESLVFSEQHAHLSQGEEEHALGQLFTDLGQGVWRHCEVRHEWSCVLVGL